MRKLLVEKNNWFGEYGTPKYKVVDDNKDFRIEILEDWGIEIEDYGDADNEVLFVNGDLNVIEIDWEGDWDDPSGYEFEIYTLDEYLIILDKQKDEIIRLFEGELNQ